MTSSSHRHDQAAFGRPLKGLATNYTAVVLRLRRVTVAWRLHQTRLAERRLIHAYDQLIEAEARAGW